MTVHPNEASRNLIWLASFPKSGNTWLRSLLANYLFAEDGPVNINELTNWTAGEMDARHYQPFIDGPIEKCSPADVSRVRPMVHRHLSSRSDGSVLVKTHNRFGDVLGTPTITPEVTYAAIYVVRSPLDVVVSFADFFGVSIDDAISMTGEADLQLVATEHQVHQFVGSWSRNVASWLGARTVPTIIVRYEAMVDDATPIFRDVLNFLKIDIDEARLAAAVEYSSFKSLRAQEEKHGFLESSAQNDRPFFRSGTAGGWRNVLTDVQADRIVRLHQAMMRRLRYLDEDGNLLV